MIPLDSNLYQSIQNRIPKPSMINQNQVTMKTKTLFNVVPFIRHCNNSACLLNNLLSLMGQNLYRLDSN